MRFRREPRDDEAPGLVAPSSGHRAVVLAPVSARRRRTDRAMRGVLAGGTMLALVPLFLVLYYLVRKGIGTWTWHFFSTDPTGNFLGDPGGIRSAILGTIEIIALASAIAIPLGIGVALYLTEFGRAGRLAALVRYFVDVMTGVPSIVFGLFVYVTLVVGSGYAAWKGAVAVALLMLPVVARSAEVVLMLVPDSLREAALALGTPRWRVVLRVVLPTAASGLLTGSLLAVARGAGETAPLLFTASLVNGTSFNLSSAMNSLPLQIFTDVQQAQDRLQARAWGAALTLVVLILLLTVAARLVSRRSTTY
jgi:phosphate transport system permease protein